MVPFIVIQHSQQELLFVYVNMYLYLTVSLNEPGCVHQMVIKTMQILLIRIAPSGLGVRFNAWSLHVLPMLSLRFPRTVQRLASLNCLDCE